MSLAASQKSIVDFVTGIETDELPITTEIAGLRLYRSLVLAEYRDLLETIYEATHLLLRERWEEITRRFVRTLPQSCYNVNRSAAGFSTFLEDTGESASVVALADFEFLQIAIGDVYLDRYTPISERKDEQFLQLLGGRPAFNPSLFIRQYSYDVPAMQLSVLDGESDSTAFHRSVNLLIFQDANTRRCLELNTDSWLLFSSLSPDKTFRESFASLSEKMNRSVSTIAPAAILELQRYFLDGLLL